MAPVERIRQAVSALWAAPPDDGVTPRRSVAFPDLLAACGEINPRVNDGFAVLTLENALRSLGSSAWWQRLQRGRRRFPGGAAEGIVNLPRNPGRKVKIASGFVASST